MSEWVIFNWISPPTPKPHSMTYVIPWGKKERKGEKGKAKKIPKIEKPTCKGVGHFLLQKLSQNFDFCAYPSQSVAKRDASGKRAKLWWCKRIFDQIKANLAEIQPKNHQNVQETPFSQKAPGFNGLTVKLKNFKLYLCQVKCTIPCHTRAAVCLF